MAEQASDAYLQNRPEAARRMRRSAEVASQTAPLRGAPAAQRLGGVAQRDTVPVETAADRFAYYLFMGTIGVGTLAMIVLSFTF